MLAQGLRRFFETYIYRTPGQSSMWFGHWILGLLFYFTVNIAIWAETIPLFEVDSRTKSSRYIPGSQPERTAWWKLAVLLPTILSCHGLQQSYHEYLYKLRTENSTYQLPSHPMFPGLLCPHYTCEVLIYLLLSLLDTSDGHIVNWTLLSATLFVAVNLGVTALGTKESYERRFGVENVKHRRRMIPWIW